MSAAAVADAASAPPKKGKKKLIVILSAVGLLLALAGGGTMFWMKKQAAAAAAAEEDGGEHAEPVRAARHDPKALPIFMPLDPFTVNLADRESERYAQVGITLEVDDAHTIEELKAYMPAIRNNILMVLAHKTSTELLERAGKEKLAAEIRREAVRPMGIELDDEDEEEDEHATTGEAKAKKKKKKKRAPQLVPVRQVHFSNFIIQ
jgi:flagellar protein FliL